MVQNVHVAQKGKRVGARRERTFQPVLLLFALGVTLAVVAWGYLVKAAIDFGAEARSGQQEAWWLLGLASLGAVACLFVGLMLFARISRRLGITQPASDAAGTVRTGGRGQSPVTVTIETVEGSEPLIPARPVGGHRAAR